jgi:hypothetical protein
MGVTDSIAGQVTLWRACVALCEDVTAVAFDDMDQKAMIA